MEKVIIIVPVVVLVFTIAVVAVICCKWRGVHRWKVGFGQRQGQTDETRSTPTNNRGRGVPSNSARSPNGSTSPPRPSTNDSITTSRVVIPFALPENTPEDSQPTEIPHVPPFSRPSNTSNSPFSLLHRNNPRSDNHYVSSTSVPNPYYYASSFDNPGSGDTVMLQGAFQEPSSMEIGNHAYEGTTDVEGQYNVTHEDVNLYHYASSSEYPMVANTGATNNEEAYQEPSTMDMAVHAYEGRYDDQEQSKALIEDRFWGGFSMANRPLPHRPSSANCKEGPTVPPRKSSRGSKNTISAFASLRQRKCFMDKENNNILVGVCSSDSNVIPDLPMKQAISKKQMGKTKTPVYHTLEDDEQPRTRLQHDNQESPTLTRPQGDTLDPFYQCLENDNHVPYPKDNHLAHGVPVSTNAQDSTDLTDSVRMIDNILYVPMTSCSKKH